MSLPLLTASLPGVGGRVRVELDDFEVEEVPAYEPSGTGDHLYLWIEKRDLGAEYFQRQLAQRLNIRPGDIGTAGMKDRRAVTRQWVSVPLAAEARLAALDDNGMRLLAVSRHVNKLKPGHLRGNRFRILIRDATGDPVAILDKIAHEGLPNYYGPQRFGRDGETARLGLAQLHRATGATRNRFLQKLALSAAQSWLFNDYLGRRMTEGFMRTVLDGDVLAKWPTGGMFTSSDVTADQPRLETREVVPAGPMFGKKMFRAAGLAAEREAAVLIDHGLSQDSFSGFGSLLDGTRRHNFIYVDELRWVNDSNGLRLSFALPAGSYATVLLREVMKAEPDSEW